MLWMSVSNDKSKDWQLGEEKKGAIKLKWVNLGVNTLTTTTTNFSRLGAVSSSNSHKFASHFASIDHLLYRNVCVGKVSVSSERNSQ